MIVVLEVTHSSRVKRHENPTCLQYSEDGGDCLNSLFEQEDDRTIPDAGPSQDCVGCFVGVAIQLAVCDFSHRGLDGEIVWVEMNLLLEPVRYGLFDFILLEFDEGAAWMEASAQD